MHRAFFSLYFFIAASVLLVGHGLDIIWQTYFPPPAVTEQDADLMKVLAAQVQTGVKEKPLALNGEVRILNIEDFANSQMAQELRNGEVVAVNDAAGNRLLYQLLADHQRILSFRQPESKTPRPLWTNIAIAIFYAAIALAVFLWLWPVSRDLRKLENHTRWVGKDDVPAEIEVRQTSPVADLANAFNRMSRRIKSLLSSYRDMTNAVSHELRTPLAKMKFALELAQNETDTAKIQRYLKDLRGDVNEMDTLINALLAYAGFEQGSGKLNLHCGDLEALCQQLVQRVQAYASPQMVFSVCNQMPHEQVTQVLCEWNLMERALFNLLQNAERFAQKTVTLTLSLNAYQYVVTVDDDGPGVPPESCEKIFQSFVRLPNTQNAQRRGFGLGLAIVRRIAHWHEGDVTVTRSPTGGARFELRWCRPDGIESMATPQAPNTLRFKGHP